MAKLQIPDSHSNMAVSDDQAPSHYLNQRRARYLTPHGVPAPQWVSCILFLFILLICIVHNNCIFVPDPLPCEEIGGVCVTIGLSCFTEKALICQDPSKRCCTSDSGKSLQWRHNGRDGVSNHQPHDCLLNRLFRRRSKKTSKLRVTGLCAGNSPVTGEFPAQIASNAENVSICIVSIMYCAYCIFQGYGQA